MHILAIATLLIAAPAAEYDRLSDATLWVEANKGMRLLVPVGNELRVRTQGRGKETVLEASFRTWATLSSGNAPNLGLLGGDSGAAVKGALLVDGVRLDSVSCFMPPVPEKAGRFTTWYRDISLTAKGLRGLAKANSKIEVACGKAVEEVTGSDLTNLRNAAKLFAASSFPRDTEEQLDRQRDFGDKESTKGEPKQQAATAAVGGEMAALRARKFVQVADCIANEFEDNEAADLQSVTKKCKGFIDSNGNLISAK